MGLFHNTTIQTIHNTTTTKPFLSGRICVQRVNNGLVRTGDKTSLLFGLPRDQLLCPLRSETAVVWDWATVPVVKPLACNTSITKHNKIHDGKCIIKIFFPLKRMCGLNWCWSAGHKPQHFHAPQVTIILIITAVAVFPEDIFKDSSVAK